MQPTSLKVVIIQHCKYGAPGDIKTMSYSVADQLCIRRFAQRYVSELHAPPAERPAPGFKVSAICPTYNRRHYLPSSITQFLTQTFTDAELIIVDDSTESVRDIVPVHPRIKYFRSETYIPTGTKRNLCCEKASGEIIVHWDDDDWQSPTRLQDQVTKLEAAGTAVLCYNNILYWSEIGKFACRCFPAFVGKAPHGATFCYRRDWWLNHRFNTNVCGEDTDFGLAAIRMQQITFVDAGQSLVVRAHGHLESTTERGNTCTTASGMKGHTIPEVSVSQIPPAFFEPLLEAVPSHLLPPVVALDDKDDVVIAVVQNQGWTELKTYAHSLVNSGFKGTKLIMGAGVSEEAKTNLKALGFTFYQNEPRPRFVVEGRFAPAIEYLESHAHRYAVWVDTRDLVFQTNPSVWLQNSLAPASIAAASECWQIKNETYNDEWARNTVGASEYAWLREHDVCCGGTLAGYSTTVSAVLRDVLETVHNKPAANDQAALNYLLRTKYKDVTRIPKMHEAFAATCSAFRTEGFGGYASRPETLTDQQPVFKNGTVLTPDGADEFCIVHQYDRDPAFKLAVEQRYAAKIGTVVMVISTGTKYNNYLQPLISSARRFMSPCEFLVFTDSTADLGAGVRKVPHEHLGFPKATLMRYHLFLSQREYLSKFKNIFYVDVDCVFVNKVGDEIISPDLTAVLHPWGGFGGSSYEDDQNSTAFVDKDKAKAYYQGCFQGGDSVAFLKMAEHIKKNIDADLEKGIVAKYHDESHLNRYLLDNPPSRVLSTEYCHVAQQPGTPRIVHFNVH